MPGRDADNENLPGHSADSDPAKLSAQKYADHESFDDDESSTNTQLVKKSTVPDSAKPGEVISNRWKIIERLGEGGMATVYKAHHLILDKIVAIKFLHKHLAQNPNSLRRFQQEGQAAGRLDHPNVIKVLDCAVTDDGRVFLVMDYLEGKSLGDLLKEHGPYAAEDAIDLFIAIAQGLKHAHSNGVLHRDLKPSNVMVTGENEIKIVDFGIAKVMRDTGDPSLQSLTQTGEIFGSPHYMSPEQCLGQPVDTRSDIYSVGCLMYELLSGKPPFQGNNSLDTIRMHIEGIHESIVDSDKDSGLHRLDLIIDKALEKDPEERYQNVDQLIEDLELVKQAPGKVWAAKRKEVELRRRAWEGGGLPIGQIFTIVVPLIWVIGVLTWLYHESPKGYIDVENYQYSFWMVLPVKANDSEESTTSTDDKVTKAIRRAETNHDPVELANTYSDAGRLEEKNCEWANAQKHYALALRVRAGLEKDNKMKSLEFIQDVLGMADCLVQEHKLSAANSFYEQAALLYDDYREDEEKKAQFHARLMAEICKSQVTGHIVPRQNSIKTLSDLLDVLRAAIVDCTTLLEGRIEAHGYQSKATLENTIKSEQADLARRLVLLEHHPDQNDFKECRDDYEAVRNLWHEAKDYNAEGKCDFALALLDGKENSPKAMADNLYAALVAFRRAESAGQQTSELSDKAMPAYLELCWKNFPWRLISKPPPH